MIAVTTPNLTDEHRANLVRFIREAIDSDRDPFSPRVRRLKALLAKIDRTPGKPSAALAKKRPG